MKGPVFAAACVLQALALAANAQPVTNTTAPVTLPATVAPASSSSTTKPVTKADVAGCPTREGKYQFNGQPVKAKDLAAACDGCTTVTYLTGEGGAKCAKYKDWVLSASVASSNKLIISSLAGVVLGAFDQVNTNTHTHTQCIYVHARGCVRACALSLGRSSRSRAGAGFAIIVHT